MEAPGWDPSDMSRFSDFTILTTTYKTIHGHEITTDILFLKTLLQPSHEKPQPIRCPILLRYHGGGLIAGYSLFAPFFNPWYLELAQEYSAVIVSPNYRLLPEATTFEILRDVEDHWKWMHESLAQFLYQHTNGTIQPDLTRILTSGDSAGGYLSIQMGLSHPEEIRAVNAVYPLVDTNSPHFTSQTEKVVLSLPTFPRDLLTRHIKAAREREAVTQQKVVVSAPAEEGRTKLMFSVCQHGLLGQFFPRDALELHPLERLDAGARFPRGGVLVLHGRDDSVVPVEGSYKLKEKIDQVDRNLNFKLVVKDGEHGFDHSAKLHDAWLWKAAQDIICAWLK
ncbi:hypothetical protein ETB97_012943 [Aspergillus alliaceus]|uniref:Alpha/beta hydrolase fold-3 domain-containing protein n=1 Tax=Petromyces alliaceus TaxID=209559 RepID=A0A8H6A8V6_PETAA|nr:hypothetical protein ETB97_012943 [Aspergillus burnettii]